MCNEQSASYNYSLISPAAPALLLLRCSAGHVAMGVLTIECRCLSSQTPTPFSSHYYPKPPNVAVRWLKLLLHISDVPSSSFGQETGYHENFLGLPQSV